MYAWMTAALLFAMLLNNYLTFWREWPGVWGVSALFGGEEGVDGFAALIQVLIYLAAILGPVAFVLRSRDRSLRADADVLHRLVIFLVRWAFWAVCFVGIADTAISFLRIEELLAPLVGDELTGDMGRAHGRVPLVHVPFILLALVTAIFTRTLGFHWLTLLVVLSELLIALSRFVFSYEQAFMADLVRFWYAALFLFASAYTLYADGHVRVDIFYARFAVRRKGTINAWGSVLFGMAFCWTILILGMATASSAINAPLISLEVTQSGFGLYIKYLMAGMLGFFAATMMLQFCSTFLEGLADRRGDPGSRLTEGGEAHGAASVN
jgi:TRAP-type mannitol/chloroaromatic compound transport system permease small subunit